MTPVSSRGRAGSYWTASRAHRYSLLFALPLLVGYELLASSLAHDPRGTGVRNGAEVLLKSLFYALLGPRGPLVFMAAVIGIAVFLVWRDLRAGGGLRVTYFLLMLIESVLLALVFGLVVGTLTAELLGPLRTLATRGGAIASMGWTTKLMLSLGAGLYEELLFRVTLVAGLAHLAELALGWNRRAAGTFATMAGALIFSAFHYVGPYGDPLELTSFVYRAISGVVFSALYLTRGFGITAWTHALYDVMVLLG